MVKTKFNHINISQCKELIESNKEGITINLSGNRTNKISGFYVSVTNNTFDSVSFLDIYKLMLNATIYENTNKIKSYIGAWYNVNTKKWYIDISLWFFDKNKALEIAKNYNQEVIFNIKKLESIYL